MAVVGARRNDCVPGHSRGATVEALRQPLEDATVAIAHATVQFPASLILIVAMNPCPRGYFTDPPRACKCSPLPSATTMSCISGPLIDRIDIHIEVPAVPFNELRSKQEGNPSSDLREQVQSARAHQLERFRGDSR